jgi:hypothetical protein
MSWDHLHPGRRPGLIMAVLLVAWGGASILWGERVPRHDGFGWDGTYYRSIVENLWEPNPDIGDYTGHRCLPSIVVNCTLRALGLPLDGPHILNTFALYNLLLLLVVLGALLAAGRELGIGVRGQWLMFLGVFCNYVHLKQHYYSACVTDVWALAFAALALLAYLKGSGAGVLLSAVAGSFTWPVLFHFGAILFLFPRRAAARRYGAESPSPVPHNLNRLVAGVAVLTILTIMVVQVWVRGFLGFLPDEVIEALLAVSMVFSGLYLFFSLRSLLDDGRLFDWREYLTRGFLTRVVVLALALVGASLVYDQLDRLFTWPGKLLGAGTFFKLVLITSIAKPGLFAVAHVIWYGPILLAAVLLWKRVCREAQQCGPGLVLTLAFGLFLGLNPESRQSLTVFPVVALLAVKVLQTQPWGRWRWAGLAGLAVLLSKVWLPLNTVPWPQTDEIPEFPMQLYFMSFGGYMTRTSYLIQGAAVLLAAGVMAAVVFWRTAAQAPAQAPAARRAA